MKTAGLAVAIALLLCPLTVTAQQSSGDARNSEPAAVAPKPQDSPLVAASKKTPAKRDKAKIRIDNATVKKSAGKLTVAPARPAPKIALQDTTEARIQKFDRDTAAWKAALAQYNEKIDALAAEIASLETVLGRFEEDYYNEDDPGYRDVLEGKYNSAEERLKSAREELARARDEAAELERSKPRL